MAGKRKPFGGQRHKGQFGRGGKRAPAPTHDIAPTDSQFGGDSDMAPRGSPLPAMQGGRMPMAPDYDNDGM